MAPKTKFIQIRLTPEDRDRFQRIADSGYLEISVWCRVTLLKAADEWERQRRESDEEG